MRGREEKYSQAFRILIFLQIATPICIDYLDKLAHISAPCLVFRYYRDITVFISMHRSPAFTDACQMHSSCFIDWHIFWILSMHYFTHLFASVYAQANRCLDFIIVSLQIHLKVELNDNGFAHVWIYPYSGLYVCKGKGVCTCAHISERTCTKKIASVVLRVFSQSADSVVCNWVLTATLMYICLHKVKIVILANQTKLHS